MNVLKRLECAPIKQTMSLLGWLIVQSDHGSMSRFSHLWAYFQLFACTIGNLLQTFSKLAGDLCGVEIQDKSIASTDLITVIKDNNLLC